MKREGQKSEGRSQKNGGRKRVEGVNRRGQERKPSPAFAAEEQIAEWLAAELPGLNSRRKPRLPEPAEIEDRRRVWRETAAED